MFLIDKYRVKNLQDVIFHKEIYKKILNINSLYDSIENSKNDFDNLPHLLVYGNYGSGKKTLINMLLRRIYGNDAIKTKNITYSIIGYGTTETQETIEQSKYHIIIEPKNTGFDKYLIGEIVVNYAKQCKLGILDNNVKFKVVLINNVDNLSYYAQAALRRIMEKYVSTCKFILCGYQISKIIEPLRSRCLQIRLPSPSKYEIIEVLMNIAANEKKQFDMKDYIDIIGSCDNNIKKAIWLLELKVLGIQHELNWKLVIGKIVKCMRHAVVKGITEEHVTTMREILYNKFITNITGIDILQELVKQLLDQIPYNNKVKNQIVELASKYGHRASEGKRCIIHLEPFINSTMDIMYKNRKVMDAIKN